MKAFSQTGSIVLIMVPAHSHIAHAHARMRERMSARTCAYTTRASHMRTCMREGVRAFACVRSRARACAHAHAWQVIEWLFMHGVLNTENTCGAVVVIIALVNFTFAIISNEDYEQQS